MNRQHELKSINENYHDYVKALLFSERNDIHPPKGLNISLKYWDQRYRLLSKFDDGVQLDEESWFSVNHHICFSFFLFSFFRNMFDLNIHPIFFLHCN